MIDLTSAEHIVRAATRCVEVLAARIAADPSNPIVPDLQHIANMAQQIINDAKEQA